MSSDSCELRALFEKALECSNEPARRVLLERECHGNPQLRAEVEALLSAHERAGAFLKPPFSVATDQVPEPAGRIFGDYELLEEIARGGMGVVYRARQTSLNRIVALKMILAGRLAGEDSVKRFRSEAQAAASLNHPNIVPIYEVGELEGHHYYTMPFVEGESLARLVQSGRWRAGDGTEAARILAQIARGVQCAHDAGILHRDLKPANILIKSDGVPCVTDFGLAKRVSGDESLTLSGQMMGTPGFMAPEQAGGKSGRSTPAADIYSLGALLYYLLTGRPPFVADSVLDVMMLALQGEAVLPRHINPGVSRLVEQICLRCLEKKPEHRYSSAGELANDLDRLLKGEPLSVTPPTLRHRLGGWARRRPALAGRVFTVCACGLIAESAFWLSPAAMGGPHYTSYARHYGVMLVLISWLLLSWLYQRGLSNERWANKVRYVWSATDPVVLTATLFIAQRPENPAILETPLVILYPTMIAAAGFWLRPQLVVTTTASIIAGYLLLMTMEYARHQAKVPFHWHLLALVAFIAAGFTVSYLVNRVGALSRFYERQPQAE